MDMRTFISMSLGAGLVGLYLLRTFISMSSLALSIRFSSCAVLEAFFSFLTALSSSWVRVRVRGRVRHSLSSSYVRVRVRVRGRVSLSSSCVRGRVRGRGSMAPSAIRVRVRSRA